MSPSYVEHEDFRVVGEWRIGCAGRSLHVRCYRLRANPDQRARGTEPFLYTVCAHYALAGFPNDEVFHLGDFWRVTDITGELNEAAQTTP